MMWVEGTSGPGARDGAPGRVPSAGASDGLDGGVWRTATPLARHSSRAEDRDPKNSSSSVCSAFPKAAMNFGFTKQELLRSTARKFFDNECASETVRRLMDGPEGMTPDLWKKIAEQGWTGLIFADEHGGMGLGFVDLVVLMEEMGRSVVPGPFFSTVLLGGLAIREAAPTPRRRRGCRRSPRETRARRSPGWSPPPISALAALRSRRRRRAEVHVERHQLFVQDAHTADVIVVAPARPRGQNPEDAVPSSSFPRHTRHTITLLPTMDQTRKLAKSGSRTWRSGPMRSWGRRARAGRRCPVSRSATVALCAKCAVRAEGAGETVAYAKIRQAFGRPSAPTRESAQGRGHAGGRREQQVDHYDPRGPWTRACPRVNSRSAWRRHISRRLPSGFRRRHPLTEASGSPGSTTFTSTSSGPRVGIHLRTPRCIVERVAQLVKL